MPFKFTGELFYKYLWDVNPYQIENVRTRYYADNNAIAYAYGIDLNIHGEFVEGIESFFKLGLLSTKEDILDDQYKEYYNASGGRESYSGIVKTKLSLIVQPSILVTFPDQRTKCLILEPLFKIKCQVLKALLFKWGCSLAQDFLMGLRILPDIKIHFA